MWSRWAKVQCTYEINKFIHKLLNEFCNEPANKYIDALEQDYRNFIAFAKINAVLH